MPTLQCHQLEGTEFLFRSLDPLVCAAVTFQTLPHAGVGYANFGFKGAKRNAEVWSNLLKTCNDEDKVSIPALLAVEHIYIDSSDIDPYGLCLMPLVFFCVLKMQDCSQRQQPAL